MPLRITMIVTLLLTLAGCSPAVPLVGSEITPALAATTPAVEHEIQQTLDRLAEAINTQNPDLLAEVFDPQQGVMQQMQYELGKSITSAAPSDQLRSYRVVNVSPHETYRVARIQRDDGDLADRVFRDVDHHWVISDLTLEELGAPERVQQGSITIYSYAAFADMTSIVRDNLDRITNTVAERLGVDGAPEGIELYLKPSLGVKPTMGFPGTLAEFQKGITSDAPNKILLSVPPSPGLSFYDPATSWSDVAMVALAHEYTHALWDAAVTPQNQTPDWIFEGAAEYVSASFWPQDLVEQRVRETLDAGTIPLNDPTGPSLDDPWDGLDAPTRRLAYTTSYLLVIYVQDTYGDDTLIDLAQAYIDTSGAGSDLHDQVFRKILGVNYDEFTSDFDAWIQSR